MEGKRRRPRRLQGTKEARRNRDSDLELTNSGTEIRQGEEKDLITRFLVPALPSVFVDFVLNPVSDIRTERGSVQSDPFPNLR